MRPANNEFFRVERVDDTALTPARATIDFEHTAALWTSTNMAWLIQDSSDAFLFLP